MSSEPTPLSTVRTWLVEHITEYLPAEWEVKPGLVTPGTIARPTVYCEYHTIDRSDLPAGFVRCKMRLIVVDHRTDVARSEDEIDAHVLELVLALTGDEHVTWTNARKTVEFAPHLGWELELDVLAGLTRPPTPEPDPEPDPDPEPEE